MLTTYNCLSYRFEWRSRRKGHRGSCTKSRVVIYKEFYLWLLEGTQGRSNLRFKQLRHCFHETFVAMKNICDSLIFVFNAGNDLSRSSGTIYRNITEVAWLQLNFIWCEGILLISIFFFRHCFFIVLLKNIPCSLSNLIASFSNVFALTSQYGKLNLAF